MSSLFRSGRVLPITEERDKFQSSWKKIASSVSDSIKGFSHRFSNSGGQQSQNAFVSQKGLLEMRKPSTKLYNDDTDETNHGSLATYFYVPNPKPGLGVCFSPTGDFLLKFGCSREISVIRAVDGKLACRLTDAFGNIRFATFSNDGKFILAASDDCHVFVYKMLPSSHAQGNSPECSCSLCVDIDVGEEPVAYCLLSPDGSVVLSCDDAGRLESWAIADGTLLAQYGINHASVLAQFSQDGRSIISCADFECGLELVDVSMESPNIVETFDKLYEGRNKAGYAIAPDGSKVVVYIKEQTHGDNIAIYDVVQKSYQTMCACDGVVLHVEFSSDGFEFIVAGRDNFIHVHDSQTMQIMSSLEGHQCDVMFCRMNGPNRIAISGDNSGCTIVWDVDHSSAVLRLQAHNVPLAACDVSRDCGRAFTLDCEGHAHLWYLDVQGVLDVMHQWSDQMSCCELLKNGSCLLVGYADGYLRLWSLGQAWVSQAWSHSYHPGDPITCLAICESKGFVASGSRDGMLLLTSLHDGQMLYQEHAAHSDMIMSLSFSADGTKILSCSRDGSVICWTGGVLWHSQGSSVQIKRPLPRSSTPIRGANGHSLLPLPEEDFNEPWTATVLTCEDYKPTCMLCCSIDPAGNIAAAVGLTGDVFSWHLETGFGNPPVHVGEVQVISLNFSADGQLLLVGSVDGSVSLLDAEKGIILRSLHGNSAGITGSYFQESTSRDLRHGKDAHQSTNVRDIVSVCSRQAVKSRWELSGAPGDTVCTVLKTADFLGLEPGSEDFNNTRNTLDNHIFLAHTGLIFYDPVTSAAMFDMREYDSHPGNSSMLRDGTIVISGGVHQQKIVVFTPPEKSVYMLANETGGVKSIDFSSDGRLLVAGNLRGDLTLWDVVHHVHIKTWMAHNRSAITAVKFTHDSMLIYSCGEDGKVMIWDWRTCRKVGELNDHQSAVVCVEACLDRKSMVSGDRSGTVIIWDVYTLERKQAVTVHRGSVLCCSISPDGSLVISSGSDEHICILSCETGQELVNLDSVLDGKGLTVKFSFDGTRVQIGGEKGNILIWNVEKSCLMYDIKAHEGSVYDCSWSGDSRRLLSVGTDGKARLWDAAAGSELTAANFERGFGVVDSGGFIKCDLSNDGTTMAGCTAKGHLILWDIGLELRKSPNGQMLYQWLASMPVARATAIYTNLLQINPLIYNAQDCRGWTVLMHAAANSSPEIIKVIVGTISQGQASLGLITAPLKSQSIVDKSVKFGSRRNFERVGSSQSQSVILNSYENIKAPEDEELNAIKIAIEARSSDCVHFLLNAILDEKVTPGSYNAVTFALNHVAQQYPVMCERFLSGLPLKELGVMEVPSDIASEGTIVTDATSYTSYKELWEEKLHLEKVARGPTVIMEAVMVQIPFVASVGKSSLLHILINSRVPVSTFGAAPIKAIITYKWQKFARQALLTKAIVYMTFVVIFTVFAILVSDDPGPKTFCSTLQIDSTLQNDSICANLMATGDNMTAIGADFKGLTEYTKGRTVVAMSCIIFLFGLYYLTLEGIQMVQLGLLSYFGSFWNFLDLASYSVAVALAPCVLLRYGVEDGGYVYGLVAIEAILLWLKTGFYGLAVEGLGTFIFMSVEIIKGLKYFYILLLTLYIGFGVAFMNLFRMPMAVDRLPDCDTVQSGSDILTCHFGSFERAMLSSFLVTFNFEDSRYALTSQWARMGVILLCVYNFLLLLIFINMIITLMADLYKNIERKQDFVFLRNRAELILEVESTMSAVTNSDPRGPPFLHVLRSINLDDRRTSDSKDKDRRDKDRSSDPGIRAQTESGAPAERNFSRRVDVSIGSHGYSRRSMMPSIKPEISIASGLPSFKRRDPKQVLRRNVRSNISIGARSTASVQINETAGGASCGGHPNAQTQKLEVKLLMEMKQQMSSMQRQIDNMQQGIKVSSLVVKQRSLEPKVQKRSGALRPSSAEAGLRAANSSEETTTLLMHESLTSVPSEFPLVDYHAPPEIHPPPDAGTIVNLPSPFQHQMGRHSSGRRAGLPQIRGRVLGDAAPSDGDMVSRVRQIDALMPSSPARSDTANEQDLRDVPRQG